MLSASDTGAWAVAITTSTLSVTDAKWWAWEPFLGHSENHPKPMYQRFQKLAPPKMGRAMLRHIPRMLSPSIRRRRFIGQGLGVGVPSTGMQHCSGVAPLLPPLPAARSNSPLAPLLLGPVAGSWTCLKVSTLLFFQVGMSVLREGGLVKPPNGCSPSSLVGTVKTPGFFLWVLRSILFLTPSFRS